jgi:hypothetical protein
MLIRNSDLAGRSAVAFGLAAGGAQTRVEFRHARFAVGNGSSSRVMQLRYLLLHPIRLVVQNQTLAPGKVRVEIASLRSQ